MSSVHIERLGRDNYESWRLQVEALLIKNDAWGYVNGTIAKPTEAAALLRWESGDVKAKADLILAISPSELRHVRGCQSSRDVWLKLKSIYASSGPARKATLLKELTLSKMDQEGDVREHLAKFFEAKDKLCEMGVEIHQDLLSVMLLNSLPASFENFRCAMESRDELPDPETLKVKIIDESNSRQQSTSNVLIVKERYKGKKQNTKEKPKFSYKCYKCHQFGHKASECKQGKKNQQSVNVIKSSSVDNVFDSDFVTFSCVPDSCNAVCSGNGKWIVDSGCTSHLCNDVNKFVDPLIPAVGQLNLATNSCTNVKGKGTVRLFASNDTSNKTINLPNALYVPDLRSNLISVAKITDKNYSVTFKRNSAIVFDANDNIVLTADRIGNLYYVREQQACIASTVSSETSNVVKSWHEKLGHLNAKDLLKVLNKSGMNFKLSDMNVLYDCDVCAKGKMTALPFSKSFGPCDEKLRIIYSDVVGPIRNTAIGGAKYFVTFIDDSTRWCEVYLLSKKSSVFTVFKIYKSFVENLTGKKIKYLQTDNGGEYCNREFDEYLQKEGIQRRLTIPHTPQMNGVAERMNRTLVEMARCLILGSGLSSGFWADAVVTACHIRNRCPTTSLGGGIPFEKWYDRPVRLHYLQRFGTKVHVLDKNIRGKDKFEARSKEGIFVGYPRDTKGYRVWLTNERRIIVARDVKFHDVKPKDTFLKTDMTDPFAIDIPNEETSEERPKTVEISLNPNNAIEDTQIGAGEHSDPIMSSLRREMDPLRALPCGDAQLPEEEVEQPPGGNGQVVERENDSTLRRAPGRPRLQRGQVGRPKRIFRMVEVETEPQDRNPSVESADEFLECDEFIGAAEVSLKEALSSGEKQDWEDAILSEIRSLVKNDTWDIVRKPAGRDVVGCRYVLTTKLNVDKTEKKKARLVAKGYSQRYGIDYHETFAPVVRLDTVRLLAALAVELGMEIHQLDINTAYLNGKLDEEIFMQVPQILRPCLEKLVQQEKDCIVKNRAEKMLSDMEDGGNVCRLKRSLYGLKQAGRQWNIRLDDKLKNMHLKQCLNEPCLYYKDVEGGKLLVAVYVDDMLIACQKRGHIIEFKRELSKEFELKDYGIAKYVLGIDIVRGDNTKIILSQQRYITHLLKKFNMENCNTSATPMEVSLKFTTNRNETEVSKQWPYRELIGSLMYLVTGTRPDIANSVTKLAQFTDKPTEEYWKAAKRILRYLKLTAGYGLTFFKTGKSVLGYSDSDWGNCLLDRRSYAGYAFVLGGACISWKSQKQRCVSTSTCEAEYVSLSFAMKEAVYLNSLLTEIGLPQFSKVTLHADNQGAIHLAGDPVFHSRSKHIDIRYHFLRTVLKNNTSIELRTYRLTPCWLIY